MGTLEIRPASERLRDLGQFRMPELDTGAARFHEAQARASLSAANAAATAGRAAVHGIASRGQVVARTLGTLGRLALDFAEQEDSRIATDAVLAKRRERNLYMYGDGTDGNPGQFNLPFDRAEDWIKGLKAENDRMDAAHTKDMNARQRRLYREAMARDEVEWQLRIGSHAARRSLQMETATAVAATAQARDEAVMKFPEAPFRDAAIKAFYDAKEHEMDVRGLSQGERQLERKAATEDFLSNLATRSFERWEAEIRADGGLRADPEAVERAWTEKGKELYAGGGKVPTNPLVRAALGSDALDEAHRTLLARRFDDARRRSVAEAYRVRSEGWRAAREEAMRRELEILKGDEPTDAAGLAAHVRKVSADYAEIADDPNLSPADRLRYLKAAREAEGNAARIESAAKAGRNERGYVDPQGRFHPAVAFPKESEAAALGEFAGESAVWQDPQRAMARLDAARMTGRLSKADYRRFAEYGAMLMDERARAWWLANYGKFDVEGLAKSAYGEDGVGRDVRKIRERGGYSAASGIFAANRGTAPKGYRTAADLVADTLADDGDGSESLVPLDVLPRVYETVRRLSRAGVDPEEAVRAILQPAVREGVERDLADRLSDPDYFRRIVADFREFGTHFTETANARAAAGKGANWHDDRARAVTDGLARQGRAALLEHGKED